MWKIQAVSSSAIDRRAAARVKYRHLLCADILAMCLCGTVSIENATDAGV